MEYEEIIRLIQEKRLSFLKVDKVPKYVIVDRQNYKILVDSYELLIGGYNAEEDMIFGIPLAVHNTNRFLVEVV